jgi:hypothetical protein
MATASVTARMATTLATTPAMAAKAAAANGRTRRRVARPWLRALVPVTAAIRTVAIRTVAIRTVAIRTAVSAVAACAPAARPPAAVPSAVTDTVRAIGPVPVVTTPDIAAALAGGVVVVQRVGALSLVGVGVGVHRAHRRPPARVSRQAWRTRGWRGVAQTAARTVGTRLPHWYKAGSGADFGHADR